MLRAVTKTDKLFRLGTSQRKNGTPLHYRGLSPDGINKIVASAADRGGLPDAHKFTEQNQLSYRGSACVGDAHTTSTSVPVVDDSIAVSLAPMPAQWGSTSLAKHHW